MQPRDIQRCNPGPCLRECGQASHFTWVSFLIGGRRREEVQFDNLKSNFYLYMLLTGDSWEKKEKENFRKFQDSEDNGGNIWFAQRLGRGESPKEVIKELLLLFCFQRKKT